MIYSEEKVEIEFPCDYPIKIMGRNVDRFKKIVLSVVENIAPDIRRNTITSRTSREGNFISITVVIVATGKPQLEQLHRELKATGLVSMVL